MNFCVKRVINSKIPLISNACLNFSAIIRVDEPQLQREELGGKVFSFSVIRISWFDRMNLISWTSGVREMQSRNPEPLPTHSSLT